MSVVGIIAEYNPFHEGHRYQMEQAKALSGAEGVIVAMSGDFVQRGEPALLSKWERARTAVDYGADLVFEIPLRGCLGDAGIYGEAGVRTILASGLATHLSFGSEAGELSILFRAAERLEEDRFQAELREAQKKGKSYPAAQEEAYRKLYGTTSEEEPLIMNSPNDLLALSYLRTLIRCAREKNEANLPLIPVPVRRKGAAYHENSLKKSYASASGIRTALINGVPSEEWASFVPRAEIPVLTDIAPRIREAEERYFTIIQSRLLAMDEKNVGTLLDAYPSGGEGIGNRLRKEALFARSTDDLIKRSKSGRYTYTRISRLLAQMVLDLPRSTNELRRAEAQPSYLKLLAASPRGRGMLRERQKDPDSGIPILTNESRQSNLLTEEGRLQREESIRASLLRNLLYQEDLYTSSDYVRHPYLAAEEESHTEY